MGNHKVNSENYKGQITSSAILRLFRAPFRYTWMYPLRKWGNKNESSRCMPICRWYVAPRRHCQLRHLWRGRGKGQQIRHYFGWQDLSIRCYAEVWEPFGTFYERVKDKSRRIMGRFKQGWRKNLHWHNRECRPRPGWWTPGATPREKSSCSRLGVCFYCKDLRVKQSQMPYPTWNYRHTQKANIIETRYSAQWL